MRIFLATARLDDIRWAADHGLSDGVWTTPALVTEGADDGDLREHLAEVCRATTQPVCVTVGAINEADIYRDGRELAKLSDHVIVQIPLIEDSVGAMRRLSAEGVRVAATFVFNAAQALLAAKTGASMVTVPVDRLDAHGIDSIEVVSEVHALFAGGGAECDLLASGVTNATQFTGCALAGADAAAIAPHILRALLLHPLTDRGVDQLLNDLSKRPKARLAT